MLKFKVKKSHNNFEMEFQCNFDKIISAIIGASSIFEFFISTYSFVLFNNYYDEEFNIGKL